MKRCIDESLLNRMVWAGATKPGDYNLAADLIMICVDEADGWTNRADDATRIPEMLRDGVRALRQAAEAARAGGG